MATSNFPVLSPTLQLGFYLRLKEAQSNHLLPALLNHVGSLNIAILDKELSMFVENDRIAMLAKRGLRGELVYPVPYILKTKPTLLGYYRLLLGFSQKEFYSGPFSRFKSLENDSKLTAKSESLLSDLCLSLIESAWILVSGIPDISEELLTALTLLTLGPQFRGSRNVALGTGAIQTVFALIKAITHPNLVDEGERHLVVRSASQRTYRIEFAPDPDIAIRQILESGEVRNRIAIEVKGGTDYSNVHNRLGEAEKSHQKAKADGFTEFWTVINVEGVERAVWKSETPTTNELFILDRITNPEDPQHNRFSEYLSSEIGL